MRHTYAGADVSVALLRGLGRVVSSPLGLVLVVVAFVATPILLLGELSASDARARVEARDLAATADAATQAAGLINVHLNDLSEELKAISRTDAFLATTSAREWASLTDLLAQYKVVASSDLERLFVFDSQPFPPAANLTDMQTRSEYPTAERLGQLRPAPDYAGGVTVAVGSAAGPQSTKVATRTFVASHGAGAATVALTVPIVPRPGTTGRGYALAADVQPDRLVAWLALSGEGSQRVYVIDESGSLLVGDAAANRTPSNLRRDPIVLAGSKNVSSSRGNDPVTGGDRLLAASPMTAADWIVVASRDPSLGLAELDAVAAQQRLLRIGLVIALLLGTVLVGRLTQRLQQQGIALEAASRHKSEFLANMSHELRTPLNAVIGFSDVLLQRMAGELNERQIEYVRDIRDAGAHQLALVNDILDLSKVEAGRMEFEPTEFSLAALIGDAVAMLRERASKGGVTLIVTAMDATLGTITADERKIKQVLFNLIVNGIKFTPSGGSVTVDGKREPSAVSVSVTDTGVGIAQADQTMIFEEFRRAGSNAGRPVEGTGLGLSLAKRFVELHGGTLRVESEPGHGARFVFVLPQPTGAAA
jgi:signal transduction histidine kinase